MAKFIKNTNYMTFEGIEAELCDIVSASKVPAEIETLGHSTEERPIYGVCFGGGDFRKPEILYYALAHSMEFVGAAVAIDLMRRLSCPGAEAGIADKLERMNVWVIPVLNPDGYAKVERQLESGLGLAAGRKNSRGVDLNRNFPVGFYHIPRSIFAGSPLKSSPYYRGVSPCSERESQVFCDFILGRNIKMSLSFHSFGGAILFPYHYTKKKCRDYDTFMQLGEEMARRQETPYSVKPAWNLYQTNGDMEDWLYDECRILSMCIEVGKFGFNLEYPNTWLNPFYWANPYDPRAEMDNVAPAALYMLAALDDLFVKPFENESCERPLEDIIDKTGK